MEVTETEQEIVVMTEFEATISTFEQPKTSDSKEVEYGINLTTMDMLESLGKMETFLDKEVENILESPEVISSLIKEVDELEKFGKRDLQEIDQIAEAEGQQEVLHNKMLGDHVPDSQSNVANYPKKKVDGSLLLGLLKRKRITDSLAPEPKDETNNGNLPSCSHDTSKKGPFPTILQLKVSLRYIKPLIWRRIQIASTDTFADLHNSIQQAMGWGSCHLSEFRVWNPQTRTHIRIVRKNEDDDDDDDDSLFGFCFSPTLDTSSTLLSEFLFAKGKRVRYTYDMGDNWEHEIVVEKVLPFSEAGAAGLPKCLAGRRACPPEDCGGVSGYYHLLEVFRNPQHNEYKELIEEWLEECSPNWEPERFDKDNVLMGLRGCVLQ